MPKSAIRLGGIARVEYVVSEQVVIFGAVDDDTPSIELPLRLLPRLIGLSLNLAGRISQGDEDFGTSLVLDNWKVTATQEGAILMQVELPGGAPLTFALQPDRARALGLTLLDPVAADGLL